MKKRLKWIFLVLILFFGILSIPEITHSNAGISTSKGSVWNGKLNNGYLIPYRGKNFKYFSPVSYYLLDNAYVHSQVYQTVLDAYKDCEQTCPGTMFRIMECSPKGGGKMLIHRTHQNGLSVDFMIPKLNRNKQSKFYDRIGIWHYGLEFTDSGKLNFNKSVILDFESMARHILALDDAARMNGLHIRKVLLKIELKDDFYQTESGKKVKERGIYFARRMRGLVNRVHDDHYHVDFEFAS